MPADPACPRTAVVLVAAGVRQPGRRRDQQGAAAAARHAGAGLVAAHRLLPAVRRPGRRRGPRARTRTPCATWWSGTCPTDREAAAGHRRADPARLGVARPRAAARRRSRPARSTWSRSTTRPVRSPSAALFDATVAAGARSTAAPLPVRPAAGPGDARRPPARAPGSSACRPRRRSGPDRCWTAYARAEARRLRRHRHRRLRRDVHRPARSRRCPRRPPTSRSPSPRTSPLAERLLGRGRVSR